MMMNAKVMQITPSFSRDKRPHKKAKALAPESEKLKLLRRELTNIKHSIGDEDAPSFAEDYKKLVEHTIMYFEGKIRDPGIMRLQMSKLLRYLEVRKNDDCFRWPDTDLSGDGSGYDSDVESYEGIFARVGYKVGKASSLEPRERHSRLDKIYGADWLPFSWAEPRTQVRLKKIAYAIAALCKRAKRRSNSVGHDMSMAIDQWVSDLGYLKQYHKDKFVWPDDSLFKEAERHSEFELWALIVHEDKVLMVYEIQLDVWRLPGGRIKLGENPEEGILREIEEETALPVRLEGMPDFFKITSNPELNDSRIRYICKATPVAAPDFVERLHVDKGASRPVISKLCWINAAEVAALPRVFPDFLRDWPLLSNTSEAA